MVGLIFGTFFPMLLLGVPVAFCLVLITIFVYFQIGDPKLFMQIPQKMFASMENPLLLAIPFFIMTGEVMNRARITDKLMNMASAMVGFMRGGLAHTNIVASMLFAGITGSAVSDTVAIGSIMMPAMKNAKNDTSTSATPSHCFGAGLSPKNCTASRIVQRGPVDRIGVAMVSGNLFSPTYPNIHDDTTSAVLPSKCR